jgi:hypothetical protein
VDVYDLLYNVNLDPSGDGASVGSVHFHARAKVTNPSADAIYKLTVYFADQTSLHVLKIVAQNAIEDFVISSDDISLAFNPPVSLKIIKVPFYGPGAGTEIPKENIVFSQLQERDVLVGNSVWSQTPLGLVLYADVYGHFRQFLNIPEANLTIGLMSEDSSIPIPQSYPAIGGAGGQVMWSMSWAEGSFGIRKEVQITSDYAISYNHLATSIGTININAQTAEYTPGPDRYTSYNYVPPYEP